GPDAVDHDEEQPRQCEHHARADLDLEYDQQDELYADVVKKDQHVPPDHLIHVDAEWGLGLEDCPGRRNEYLRSVSQYARHQVEQDDACSKIQKVLVEALIERLGIHVAQSADHHRHADGDPERAHDRAPVALANVVPADQHPQLPTCKPLDQIPERFVEPPLW